MGKKSGSSKEAAQARADEQARQEEIRKGTKRINQIFDGGTAGAGQLKAGAVFDPKAQYYLDDGTAWKPDASLFPVVTQTPAVGGTPTARLPRVNDASTYSDPGSQSAIDKRLSDRQTMSQPARKTAAEQFADALASGKLYSSATKKSGFDDNYFNKVQQSYIDYADPQLNDQHSQAKRELTFALDRSGLLDSSARSEKEAELQKKLDLNRQQIRDQARTFSTQARSNVEDARSNLITMLNATGDAQGASNSAIARATALSKPQSFSPLSNLFADFMSGLGTQAAAERATAMSGGAYRSPYSTGLFNSSGAVKVTG